MAYPLNISRLLNTAGASPATRWFFRINTAVFVLSAIGVLALTANMPLTDSSVVWQQTLSYVLLASVALELTGVIALAVKILMNVSRNTK